jgi:DsbC/DsbD-like thiol-disulfide interchange protein
VSSAAHVRFVACLLLSAAAAAAQVSPASIQPTQAQHARVELLSRKSSLTPGAGQQLGVHFVLEPGWHIYWINPGDSGQPPVFKWQLPEGFSIGEIRWPRPERMQPIKELADYGYHNEVLLPLTLHVPSAPGSHASAEIGVEAKWLVCREVCIPEHAQLHLSLPVAAQAKPNPSAARLFATTEKLVPKPWPRGWKISITSGKDDFVLAIRAGQRITKAEFFPLEPGQIDNAAPQKIEPFPTGITITLKKSDLLLQPIAVLRGVLVIPGSAAYRIEAPVRQPIQ